MKIEIVERTLKIKINNKINKLNKKELIEIFCIIKAFRNLEKDKGNEYEKASIKLEYIKGLLVKEYINIFKIVRVPILYDFLEYFLTIEERFDVQNTETKMNLEDYMEKTDYISQEIIIIMVFKIQINIKELNKKKNLVLKLIKNEIEIFDEICKEIKCPII